MTLRPRDFESRASTIPPLAPHLFGIFQGTSFRLEMYSKVMQWSIVGIFLALAPGPPAAVH